MAFVIIVVETTVLIGFVSSSTKPSPQTYKLASFRPSLIAYTVPETAVFEVFVNAGLNVLILAPLPT